MLTRYRWYRIQLPGGAPDLAAIVTNKPLQRDTTFGFVRVQGSIGAPAFRFLWRTRITITRFDEEGNTSYEAIDTINSTDFAIVSVDGVTFLRIENPGRNIRDLLNALESLVGLGFTSYSLRFDKMKPTTIFESVDASRMVGLKVVGAVLHEDLVARIDLASKNGVDIENMKILTGLRYRVDSAVYDLVHEGVRGQFAFTSSGLVKISGQLAPKLVPLVEQDLPKLAHMAPQ